MPAHEHAEVCQEHMVHTDIVEHVKPDMPDEESLYDLADFVRVI